MSQQEYLAVNGPVDQHSSIIIYDIPFAPDDPRRSLQLRNKMNLGAETRTINPNVRVVIDSFIRPRTWVDENNVRWVQYASPFPATRIQSVTTRKRLHDALKELDNFKSVGVSFKRSQVYDQCFLELIRQVTADCWERGLLLLKVYSVCVKSQQAHRELFESRTGYAFRLALKGDKDTAAMVSQLEILKKAATELTAKEAEFQKKCDAFAMEAEEQLLIDEKKRADEIAALKKEMSNKKTQLEALTAPIPKQ